MNEFRGKVVDAWMEGRINTTTMWCHVQNHLYKIKCKRNDKD